MVVKMGLEKILSRRSVPGEGIDSLIEKGKPEDVDYFFQVMEDVAQVEGAELSPDFPKQKKHAILQAYSSLMRKGPASAARAPLLAQLNNHSYALPLIEKGTKEILKYSYKQNPWAFNQVYERSLKGAEAFINRSDALEKWPDVLTTVGIHTYLPHASRKLPLSTRGEKVKAWWNDLREEERRLYHAAYQLMEAGNYVLSGQILEEVLGR